MSSSKKQTKPTKLQLWLAGARLRTLPLAVAPVLLGSVMPLASQRFSLPLALLALAVAVLLQVGVNFANDYSDGIRGTDANRVGPQRLVGSGAVEPALVKRAAFLCFGLAALAGLAIVGIDLAAGVTGAWWLIAIGALSILAAWYYTGGKRPYGYAGLGDLMVFIFFGLVATVGTSFAQQGYLDQTAFLLGAAAGFFACSVLMVNNIRDRVNDAKVGKKTLSVRVGSAWSKVLFLLDLWLPFAIITLISIFYPRAMFGWFALLLTGPATVIFLMAKSPKDLIQVLKLSSYAALLFAALEFVTFAS
jgi:1,4-dihydroxy-2-naphthoate polyprenyltransferase